VTITSEFCFVDFRRFIINIPDVESRDIVRRVFFQIELAHWFYLDFYLPENPDLRSVTLKEFSAQNILCLNKIFFATV